MSADLEQLVLAGDLGGIRAALKDLPEPDRRKLAKTAIDLYHRAWDSPDIVTAADARERHERMMVILGCADVFVLATATPSEILKHGIGTVLSGELIAETLMNRSIDLSGFADVLADFKARRALIRHGRIERPDNPDFVIDMINQLGDRDRTIYDDLKADPGLLEHEVWQLFEVEGVGEASLATHDKYNARAGSWTSTLLQLGAEGMLPRDRLLDASLAALRRDFAAFRAGWFSRFHEALRPTPEERRERVRSYLALLSSPVPATVSFAIHALAMAGEVPVAEIDQLRPALESRTLTTVRTAVKLLPRSPKGTLIITETLARATRAAQSVLLTFLERVGSLEPAAKEAAAKAAPSIAPAFHERLQRLLGTEKVVFAPALISPALAPQQIITEVAPPVQLIPELVELLAALLERIDEVHNLERAIDGVSRLCDRSDGTLRRLQPVADRAARLPTNEDAFQGKSPRGDIAGLVLAWSTGEAPSLPDLAQAGSNVLGFLSYRVLEVAARAASGVQQPILSLPTAADGSIDPAVLELRRKEHARLGLKPGQADSIQAALRAGEIAFSDDVHFTYTPSLRTHHHAKGVFKQILLQVHSQPPFAGRPRLDRVPELFLAALAASDWDNRTADREERNFCGPRGDASARLTEAVRWVATVWPGNREPYYANGATELGHNIDWWGARWHARCFLEPMLLPTEPIGKMARLLLALGLAAKEPGERTLATDVLIAVINEDRLDCAALAGTLARLYDGRVVKGTRLAVPLAEVGRVSQRHAMAMIAIIEEVLANLKEPPAPDLHALLAILSDLLAPVDLTLKSPAAYNYLRGIVGASKTASLAKSLTSSQQLGLDAVAAGVVV